MIQRINIDIHHRSVVTDEGVADDNRLAAADINHGRRVSTSTVANAATGTATGIFSNQAVGDSQVGLVCLDHIKVCRNPFDR